MSRIQPPPVSITRHPEGWQVKRKETADFSKTQQKSIHALTNAARRQTIPAFREAGVWKIGVGISAAT